MYIPESVLQAANVEDPRIVDVDVELFSESLEPPALLICSVPNVKLPRYQKGSPGTEAGALKTVIQQQSCKPPTPERSRRSALFAGRVGHDRHLFGRPWSAAARCRGFS